jgi:hypothetical protein
MEGILLSSVISFVSGILISSYFWLITRKKRKLVYAVNPVKTSVVVSGQTHDLDVYYNSVSLGNVDITAVQIAVWNAGNETIGRDGYRDRGGVPTLVITENSTKLPVKILEATVRNQYPSDVVDFKVNSEECWVKG